MSTRFLYAATKMLWLPALLLIMTAGCQGTIVVGAHNDASGADDSDGRPNGMCEDGTCQQDASTPPQTLSCLQGLFGGAPGQAAEFNIPIEFNGRMTIGDLDNDGIADFVVSTRDRIAAYTVCGDKLWDVATQTNWDYTRHYFWNLTTYGYVGDADGDGAAEFMHITSDWHTLLVRDGITGAVKHTIALPSSAQWMYVFLARRAEDTGLAATRVVVAGPAYASDFDIATYDLRSGSAVAQWTYSEPMGAAKAVYLTPQTANLDAQGGDEIFYGTLALSESGQKIWRFDVGGMSILSAIHASTAADIDPSRPGLEVVHSIYAPNPGQPSFVTFGAETKSEIWRTYSPHSELHPHQHAVGDFDLDHAGLEILARNTNGINHWMANARGEVIRGDWRVDPGWGNAGEYVQAIHWDAQPGTEVLYLERHVANDGTHAIRSRMVVVSPHTDTTLTPQLAGGTMEDTRGWTGMTSQDYFNPYEAAGLVADVFGDGREEIIAWGGGKITIYYNTGDEGVPKRWPDLSYQMLKKMSCYLYSPR